MKRHLFHQALALPLLLTLGSACSAPETAAAPTTTPSGATLHGVVERELVSPQGDVDGLLLRDGTIVRVPPGTLAPEAVAPGDNVDVQGDLTPGTALPIVERASVSREGTPLTAAMVTPVRRRGPAADAALQAMTATGAIRALLYNREGLADGLVLDDGTTARVPPRAGLGGLNLKVGDRVTVAGRGTVSSAGKGLRAETITLPSGTQVVVDAAPPIPTALSREGTVQRVLVNPHGDIDLLLLSDGSAVRIPPSSSLVASKLAAGQTVHIEGDSVGFALHATQVRLTSGEVVASEPTTPPPPPLPDTLARVDEASTITRMLQGPRGEVDTLILADGAVIRLPPRLAEEAAAALKVGEVVHVEGVGGRYPLGTSLRAGSLRLDSGQTFVDPGPPPPPAAGGPPAPPPPPPPR